jgi:hypothetical protein
MARAQRQADLRDERVRRRREGVRAGTEPAGFLDRLESSGALDPANYGARYVGADWPLDARPDEASVRLAEAWLTWVGRGPVAGPDGVAVRIWIRSAGQDVPLGHLLGDQEWVPRGKQVFPGCGPLLSRPGRARQLAWTMPWPQRSWRPACG